MKLGLVGLAALAAIMLFGCSRPTTLAMADCRSQASKAYPDWNGAEGEFDERASNFVTKCMSEKGYVLGGGGPCSQGSGPMLEDCYYRRFN